MSVGACGKNIGECGWLKGGGTCEHCEDSCGTRTVHGPMVVEEVEEDGPASTTPAPPAPAGASGKVLLFRGADVLDVSGRPVRAGDFVAYYRGTRSALAFAKALQVRHTGQPRNGWRRTEGPQLRVQGVQGDRALKPTWLEYTHDRIVRLEPCQVPDSVRRLLGALTEPPRLADLAREQQELLRQINAAQLRLVEIDGQMERCAGDDPHPLPQEKERNP